MFERPSKRSDRRKLLRKHRAQIGNSRFVAPYASSLGPTRQLSGLVKVNADQVPTYLKGKGALSQILLDFGSFDLTPSDFRPQQVADFLDHLKEVVLMHPEELRQAIGMVHAAGGYTPEVGKLAAQIGMPDLGVASASGAEVFASMTIVAMSATPACASNDPLGPYPGDPEHPGGDPGDPGDPGGGGGGGGSGGSGGNGDDDGDGDGDGDGKKNPNEDESG